MISKIIQKSCIALFLISTVTIANAQDVDLALVNLQIALDNQNNVDFYDGQVQLKNNETYQGRISLNHFNGDQYAVLLRTNDGCTHISNEEINSVTLFGNDRYKTTETQFVSLEGHDKLFRILYKKDDGIAVYDSIEKPFDNSIMNDVYILEDNELVSIFNFWSSGPKKDIINYLNERDNSNYKRRDFKSLDDLFAKL